MKSQFEVPAPAHIDHTPANEFTANEVEAGLDLAREICIDNEVSALGGHQPQCNIYAIMLRREDNYDPRGGLVWVKAPRSIISPMFLSDESDERLSPWVGLDEEGLKAWALSKLPMIGTFQPIKVGGKAQVVCVDSRDSGAFDPLPYRITIVVLVD